jgi:hypothetical protein
MTLDRDFVSILSHNDFPRVIPVGSCALHRLCNINIPPASVRYLKARQMFRSPLHGSSRISSSCGEDASSYSSLRDSDRTLVAFVFFCSPVGMTKLTARFSAEFGLIRICVSQLSAVSIRDISSGEALTTPVLIYLECRDVLFHTDESEIQMTFIIFAVTNVNTISWNFCCLSTEYPMMVLTFGQIEPRLLVRP